jgi:hypothetical protein
VAHLSGSEDPAQSEASAGSTKAHKNMTVYERYTRVGKLDDSFFDDFGNDEDGLCKVCNETNLEV